MESEEFKSLLEKYSRGECTAQEEKLINDWYENIQPEHEDVPQLSEMSDDYKQIVEDRIWAKVSPHPPATSQPRELREGTVERSAWYYPVRIAAALAVIATAAIFLSRDEQLAPVKQEAQAPQEIISSENPEEHVVNNTTRPSRVQLADGSTVTLQPRSEITFAKAFNGNLREVRLIGEASFDVARDVNRPFKVYSGDLVTQVLGTSFIVKAYQGDKNVTVTVRSGKVQVYPTKAAKKTVILVPNQKAVYDKNNDEVVRDVVEHPEIILPKSNLFHMSFDETPVSQIFDVLRENYGIDIVYDKETLSKCSLTTAMSDEGLFERIEVICKAIKATYRVNDGVILIDSPGCE